MNFGFYSLSAADGCCAYRDVLLLRPRPDLPPSRWSRWPTPTLPQVAVPDLLDPQGEPILSDRQPSRTSRKPTATMPYDAASAEADAAILPRWSRELRSPDAGSRELDCLATGIYFESKSEPLAGQLAVGKVIANRAAERRPLSRRPIAACCSSAASSRSSTAIRCRPCRMPTSSGRPPSRSPRSSTRTSSNRLPATRLFFHARYVSPGWHAEARRLDRQSHLLPLSLLRDAGAQRAGFGSPAFFLATILF